MNRSSTDFESVALSAFHLTEKGSILLSEVITENLANLFENAQVNNSPDTKSQIFPCK